jgi:hypothetical protein
MVEEKYVIEKSFQIKKVKREKNYNCTRWLTSITVGWQVINIEGK